MATPTLTEVSADIFFEAIKLPKNDYSPGIEPLVTELQAHLEQSLALYDAMLAPIPERFYEHPDADTYGGWGYDDVHYNFHAEAHGLYTKIFEARPACFGRVRYKLKHYFEKTFGFEFKEKIVVGEDCEGYAQRVVDFILESLPVPLEQIGVDQLIAEGNRTFGGGRQPPELKSSTVKFFYDFYLDRSAVGGAKLSWHSEEKVQLLFRMVYYFVNGNLKPHDFAYPELRNMVGRGHSFYALTFDTFQNGNGVLHFESSSEAERFYRLFQLGQQLGDG
jgi:hypothetical protein